MSEATKEMTLKQPMELTEAEINAVAGGQGPGTGSDRQCFIFFKSAGKSGRTFLFGPGLHSQRCMGTDGGTDGGTGGICGPDVTDGCSPPPEGAI
jgi:hypothetical protein